MSRASSDIVRLERALEERFRGHRVVAVSSGTAALEAILTAIGIGQGSTVLAPEYGFPSGALAAKRLGAQVVLGSVEIPRLTLSPDAVWPVEGDAAPDAAIVIDVAGYPADWKGLEEGWPVQLVEDACAAWGGVSSSGEVCGGFGAAAAFSLSQTKILAAGEGGLVVTADDALADRVELFRRYGEIEAPPLTRTFAVAGTNWKMAEPVAAVALEQLELLDERLERGRVNRRIWDAALGECNYLAAVPVDHDGISPHKYRVLLKTDTNGKIRDVAREIGLQLLDDEVGVLWNQPGSLFYDPRPDSGVLSTLRRSFVIPSRATPIWELGKGLAEGIGERLIILDGRADEWLR